MDRIRILFVVTIFIVSFLENVYGCGKGKGKGDKGDNGDKGKPPISDDGKNPLGDNVKQEPMDNSGYDKKGGKANSPDDLKCDFEGPCCWKNSKPRFDTMDYLKTSGTISPDIMQKLFGTSTAPSGNFLSAIAKSQAGGGDKAELESCSIPCAGDSIKVTLKNWTSKDVKVEVCEVAMSDPNTLLSCQPLPSGNPGPGTVTLPPGSDVSIAIIATNFISSDGGVALIDDITVEYPPCSSSVDTTSSSAQTASATTPPGPGPTQAPTQAPPPPDDTADAAKVCCTFDQGSCSYSKGGGPKNGGGNVQEFSPQKGHFRNPATGTVQSPDGSYLAAYLKPKEKAYTECETNFLTEKRIKFAEYKATQGISLKACCDSEQGCTYDTGDRVEKGDFRQWYGAAIKCPAGTKKVIFYAENNDVNEGGVAIDNVEVYDENNNKIC